MNIWLAYLEMMRLHIRWGRIGLENYDVEEHAKGAGRAQTVCTQEDFYCVSDLIKQNRRLTTSCLAAIKGFSNGITGTIIS